MKRIERPKTTQAIWILDLFIIAMLPEEGGMPFIIVIIHSCTTQG